MTDIGALLGNKLPNDSYGYGINDAGHVAGEAQIPIGTQPPFFTMAPPPWTSGPCRAGITPPPMASITPIR